MSTLPLVVCAVISFAVLQGASSEETCPAKCVEQDAKLEKRIQALERAASDECSPTPCLNGGTCVDGVNDFTCQCKQGFTGKTCDKKSACASSPCKNGAACVAQAGGFECKCRTGYSGETCDTAKQCPLTGWVTNRACTVFSKDCDHIPNGDCIYNLCQCKPGYMRDKKTRCCVNECSEISAGSTHRALYLTKVEVSVPPLSSFKQYDYNRNDCFTKCGKNKDCAFYIKYNAYGEEGVSYVNQTCSMYGLNAVGKVTSYTPSIKWPNKGYKEYPLRHILHDMKLCAK